MADILIRGISEKTLKKLKSCARKNNRSLQQELKEMIEYIASSYTFDISKRASRIRKKLKEKGINFTDSTELLREDRCR